MITSWPDESSDRPLTRADRMRLRLLVDFLVWLLAPGLSERRA